MPGALLDARCQRESSSPESDGTGVPCTVSLRSADGGAGKRRPRSKHLNGVIGRIVRFPILASRYMLALAVPPSGAATTATALPLLDLLDFETATGWRSVAD